MRNGVLERVDNVKRGRGRPKLTWDDVGPCNQGPGEQPAHLPLPLLDSKVEEELSSSAHTHTALCVG